MKYVYFIVGLFKVQGYSHVNWSMQSPQRNMGLLILSMLAFVIFILYSLDDDLKMGLNHSGVWPVGERDSMLRLILIHLTFLDSFSHISFLAQVILAFKMI